MTNAPRFAFGLRWVAPVLVVLAVPLAAAQDRPPVLVIAAPGYQRFLDATKFLGELTADRKLAERIGKLMSQLGQLGTIQLEALPGVDPARPWGAVGVAAGAELRLVGLVPVTDADAFLAHLASAKTPPAAAPSETAPPAAAPAGVGTLSFSNMVTKARDGWVAIATRNEDLDAVADPQTLLSEVAAGYDLAIRYRTADLPAGDREQLLGQLSGMLPSEFTQADGEGAQQFAFRSQLAAHEMAQLQSLLAESEETKIGWRIDQEAVKLLGELSVKPAANSSLAAKMTGLIVAETKLAGMLADTDSVALHVNVQVDPAQIEELNSLLGAYRGAVVEALAAVPGENAERRTAVDGLAAKLLDLMQASVATGRVHLAVKAIGKGPPMTVVMAAQVAQTSDWEAWFQELGAQAAGDPLMAQAKLNALEHAGIKIHSFTLAKGAEATLLDTVLKSRRLLVAVAGDLVYLAGGPKAEDELKKALSAAPASAAGLQARMHLGPVVSVAGRLLPDKQLAAVLGLMGMNFIQGSDGPLDDSMRIDFVHRDGHLVGTMEAGSGTLRVTGMIISLAQQFLSAAGQGGQRPGGRGLGFQ